MALSTGNITLCWEYGGLEGKFLHGKAYILGEKSVLVTWRRKMSRQCTVMHTVHWRVIFLSLSILQAPRWCHTLQKNPSDTWSTTNRMCTGLGSNMDLIKSTNNEIHVNTFFTDAILKLRSAAGDDIVDCTPGAICIDRARPIVLLDLSSVNWESSESNVKSNFMSTPSSL